MPPTSLIAVDIGNSQVKLGLFTGQRDEAGLPTPVQVREFTVSSFDPASLEEWFAAETADRESKVNWWIASVNRGPTQQLLNWLEGRGTGRYCLLKHSDLPLAVELPQPDRVGIDRLLGAVAANRLRAAGRPAVVIDVGSAITVDLVSSVGAFLGGAILPGIGMSARAMHAFTDRLPRVAMDKLADPPPALGTSTIDAMRSGLYWGAIGAMKELIARLTGSDAYVSSAAEPAEIFLTGGAAPVVAQFLAPRAKCIPHLVLGGIALVAE